MKSHKGKPKPQTGLGFPQRLRERERKTERKTSPANIPITREKKERTTNTKANKGAGPKGHQTKQHFNPQDQENHTENQTTIPKAPNKRPLTSQTESQRNCHSKVEGPMGRPALLGSHPRGPQYRGVQVPPHYGNCPRWRKNKQRPRQKSITPKDVDPALSRSSMLIRFQTIR